MLPKYTIGALVLLLACVAMPAGAQDSGEDGRALLERSARYISALPAFTVDLEMSFAIASKDGESRGDTLTGSLAIAGTDRARFEVNVDEGTLELFYAPDSKYLYISEQNQYIEGTSFGERQHALALMPAREFRTAQMLFSAFIHNDLARVEEATAIEIVSPETENEEGPVQVRVSGGGIQTDYWIRRGEKPLLEKFAMDLSEVAAASSPEIASVILTYNLSDWNVAPTLDEGYFNFNAPEGAKELEQPAAPGPTASLEGKPAPPIELELFGQEGKLDLSAHQGKDIVILDFWASWCGPCRIGLPIVTEVAGEFADKNVVLYAVNIREDPKLIKAFIEQTNLTATVAMDANGEAQQKYGANSIPMTVIINRDGTVHRVHTGVSPDFKGVLTQELAALTE